MINVLLNGCNGRMGKEVVKAIDNNKEFEIICGVSTEKTEAKFKIYTNINEIKEKVDVIIDFTIPSATINILEYARKNKVPIVIATTGLSEEDMKKIKESSNEIPIFQSANMSFDICLMKKIVSEVAKSLSETDIEIIETHHNKKIDAPSGTAIMLADSINEVLESKKEYEFNRFSKREKRNKNQIGFSSIRGGNIVGEHTVSFYGENETFEITHKAYSRGLFAEGALKGAKFIINKKAGLYSMEDLVNEQIKTQ